MPEFSTIGSDGRRYVRFSTQYEFDGKRWSGEVWAVTWEEAEMKLRAMAGGEVIGITVEEGEL